MPEVGGGKYRAHRGVQRSYGFLSYGRTPHAPESHRPPDKQLRDFHAELTDHLLQITDLDAKTPAVYLDTRIQLGLGWEDELKLRLAHCQVLVPVLSRRLFSSKWCALEWKCFELRQQLQREQGKFTRNAIVPVLWNGLRPDEIPLPYSAVEYDHQDLGPDYTKLGLLGLRNHGRHATHRKVVYQLALEIVEVAVTAGLEPCDPSLFDDLFDELVNSPNGSAGEEH
ncbi:TIR domain-containing protein [Streptomyces sp. 3213]|uniref:TIR-like protein FxsC n=1 Tax=Streptomyces sp. 3213.3 TaxID=1855348 RepID=UPI000894760C|nr:TIR-like protein FxsC [Streptomyces sp. 3213.3]SEE65091.1 TIR domain-containing protein [Streptomyces sp. 3213] [Streptomyces sp. 3213.3]